MKLPLPKITRPAASAPEPAPAAPASAPSGIMEIPDVQKQAAVAALAGYLSDPTVTSAPEYSNLAVTLSSALDRNGSWWPAEAVLIPDSYKIIVPTSSRKFIYIIEGLIEQVGPGMMGSMRIKKDDYRQVKLQPGMRGAVMLVDQGIISASRLQSIMESLCGVRGSDFKGLGRQAHQELSNAVWLQQKLVGLPIKVRMVPNTKQEDEFGREAITFHNPSIYTSWGEWLDFTQPPVAGDPDKLWPILEGVPEFAEEAPAPVDTLVADVPPPAPPAPPAPRPVEPPKGLKLPKPVIR